MIPAWQFWCIVVPGLALPLSLMASYLWCDRIAVYKFGSWLVWLLTFFVMLTTIGWLILQ